MLKHLKFPIGVQVRGSLVPLAGGGFDPESGEFCNMNKNGASDPLTSFATWSDVIESECFVIRNSDVSTICNRMAKHARSDGSFVADDSVTRSDSSRTALPVGRSSGHDERFFTSLPINRIKGSKRTACRLGNRFSTVHHSICTAIVVAVGGGEISVPSW